MEHVDVIVVGAGISGISTAYYLGRDCPDRSFVVLEGRSSLGGTWDLFRYPGIRSDSDMYTLGFSFRPWTRERAIADGASIREYVADTATEFGIDAHIRFGHHVRSADWDPATARWTVTIDRSDRVDGDVERITMTCSMLAMCSGYYRYASGYTPDFPGRDRFGGVIVHPQQWPDDLDYADRKVVVIGSGATAVTLVPAMAPDVEHITMLQRSPTWVVARPAVDAVAAGLNRALPRRWASRAVRVKNAGLGWWFYTLSRRSPERMRALLLKGTRAAMGDEMTDAHFTPDYNPWDQRLCLVPDGDLFDAINSGKASVVTDTIATFTETGIQLDSGDHLDADIIITATGLQLVTLGEVAFSIDGDAIDFADTFVYKGLAYSGVPNLISTFGFVNASWTLRAEMISEYTCRVLNHMKATDTEIATPQLRRSDRTMTPRPLFDQFTPGYITRELPRLPKQGDSPWVSSQDVVRDRRLIAKSPVDDGVMRFTSIVQPDADRRDGTDSADSSEPDDGAAASSRPTSRRA